VPAASVGYRLGGGGVPFVIQLRIASRSTLTSSTSDTGLCLGNVPDPQLLPGQFTPFAGRLWLKPPLLALLPPCVVRGT